MALIVKALGVGNINVNSATDLYTVPAGGSAIISSVRLTNNSDANSASVNLMVDPSGSVVGDVRVSKKDYPLAVGAMMVMEDELTLGQGDKLRAQVNGTSPTIHYVVNGVERA